MIYKLIEAALRGDEQAFVKLYRQYMPMVNRLQGLYYIRGYRDDDWAQEARIALYRAIKTYKVQSGVSFGCYYKRVMINQIFSLLRKQNALKRREQKDEVSIEQKVSVDGADFLAESFSTEPAALQFLLLKEAVDECPIQFSKRELYILHKHVLGYSAEEMANELGVELRQVTNAYSRVKAKLRTYISTYRFT
ncbi:MAG: RNA polymerase sigma factor [Enterococcus sp.]